MMKKGDLLIVAVVILAALLVTWWTFSGRRGNGSVVAVIKQGDKVIRRINLNEVKTPEKIDVSAGYHEVILLEKGQIRFEEANCPDKLCVKSGWLSKQGDMAACLPNRTIIKIEGQSAEVDGGTY